LDQAIFEKQENIICWMFYCGKWSLFKRKFFDESNKSEWKDWNKECFEWFLKLKVKLESENFEKLLKELLLEKEKYVLLLSVKEKAEEKNAILQKEKKNECSKLKEDYQNLLQQIIIKEEKHEKEFLEYEKKKAEISILQKEKSILQNEKDKQKEEYETKIKNQKEVLEKEVKLNKENYERELLENSEKHKNEQGIKIDYRVPPLMIDLVH